LHLNTCKHLQVDQASILLFSGIGTNIFLTLPTLRYPPRPVQMGQVKNKNYKETILLGDDYDILLNRNKAIAFRFESNYSRRLCKVWNDKSCTIDDVILRL
jgi:hypothetical protein